MARLTSFSKLLITIAILAGAYFGFTLMTKDSGDNGGGNSGASQEDTRYGNNASDRPAGSDDVIRVGVVTWGGYAGGQYFNRGFKPSAESMYRKEYGIDVEFVLNDDVVSSLNAFKNGDIDVHWYTIDAFPTILPDLADFDPVVLYQADWSRGGDAVVVRRGINSVADLRGKSIAVGELTPSHTFLLYLLEAGGLSADDVDLKFYPSAVESAQAFKTGVVDAAVVWSPDDELSVRAVPGAKVLESTKTATNIIADIFFAKREYVENNREALQALYEGWMKGAAEINNSPSARQEAAQILAREMDLTPADADAMIGNVRLTTHGDNQDFFGFNTNYRGTTGEELYSRMAKDYQSFGYIDQAGVAGFRQVSYGRFVNSSRLSGPEHKAEGQATFDEISQSEGEAAEAIAVRQVSVNFETGSSTLDDRAKNIIDEEMVPIARAFAGSRIRVEGNTDNTGSRATNVELSRRRAQAVVAYLVREYNFDTNRFVVVGNGPDNPVSNNSSAGGRAANRRTDFALIRD
ncbi:MAG: phosphate ABC transporter substrate-binding/OmpA family protein [Bacteroidota bacterium]